MRPRRQCPAVGFLELRLQVLRTGPGARLSLSIVHLFDPGDSAKPAGHGHRDMAVPVAMSSTVALGLQEVAAERQHPAGWRLVRVLHLQEDIRATSAGRQRPGPPARATCGPEWLVARDGRGHNRVGCRTVGCATAGPEKGFDHLLGLTWAGGGGRPGT
jgi:hypothetical protein